MLMDLDFGLDDDHISSFLQSKLEEIKLTNAQLEKSLSHRQNILSTLQLEIETGFNSQKVQITQISKKLFNNKYILILGLTNESNKILDNINVLFDWNSPSPLSYKFWLISSKNPTLLIDGLRCTHRLEDLSKIIIVLEVPYFTQQLTYFVTASISFRQDGKKSTLKLPSTIRLAPEDISDNSLHVQIHKVIDGNIDDFLACASTNEKHEFVMVITTNWSRLLETRLEVDCSLCKVNIISNKRFFIVQKLCPLLDGTLLELDDSEFNQNQSLRFNIYCRNQDVLIAFLHLLYKHIAQVIIVSKKHYCSELSLHDATELIKDSLLDELNHLESVSSKNLIKFRSDIAALEQETDLLVFKLNKNMK